jgi:hypothetical protein|tara:strand:- start:1131 stop:4187 length:3057 start_codon:yes stop_codon:yes gene_type:complete
LSQHLTIVAGDRGLGEAFAQWAEADLIDATAFVDLGSAGEELDASVHWTRSGLTTLTTLEEVATLERWDPVTFVSVRSDNPSSFSTAWFETEALLLDTLRSLFLSNIEFQAFTVGIAEPDGSYGADLFDPNWQLHLLHDPILIADADVAVLPIRSRDRPTTCLLTALLAAGGFRWQEKPLLHLNDNPVGRVLPARIVRAQLRLVNAGKFIDDVLAGAFPDSGPWTVPPDVQAIMAPIGSPIDPGVAKRLAIEAGFTFRPFKSPHAKAPAQIGILAGLRLFIRNFATAARKAPLIVIERISSRVGEGVAAAAQQLTFGDRSSVVMKFRPGLARDDTDNLLNRLQEIGMPDTRPSAIPDPHPWTLLRQACFGLVDGGDLPEGLPIPERDTRRLLYLDPTAIGPAPDEDDFTLSPLEIGLLELDAGLEHIGPMDVDNARAVARALADISDLDQTTESIPLSAGIPPDAPSMPDAEENDAGPEVHRPGHPDFDPSAYRPVTAFYQGPLPEIPEEYRIPQTVHQEALREHESIDGPWHNENRCDHCGTPSFHHGVCYIHEPTDRLVHVGHICAKKSGLHLPDKNPAEGVLQSLQDRWQRWLVARQHSLLWQIGTHLVVATDNARQGLATGMAEREAPDRSTEEVEKVRAKLRLGTIRSGAAAVVAGIATIANVFLVFLPFLWLAAAFVGMFASLIIQGTRFTRELARVQTRQDAGSRTRREALLKVSHCSSEFARLVNTRDQFQDWQAVIRTVVHRPYGRPDAGSESELTSDDIMRPQSYVHGTANPTSHQLRNAQANACRTTFKRGWLTTVFLEMKQQWEDDYAAAVLYADGQVPQPESDNSAAGSVRSRIPGSNEPIFAEREDFRIRLTGGQLHEAVIAAHTATIVKWLTDLSLDELLSPVSVTGPGRALSGLSPEAFLRGLEEPLAEVPIFRPEVFSTEPDALHLRLDNLDSSHPKESDAPPLIVPSAVSPGRDLVFARFRLLLSAPTAPAMLAGFRGDTLPPVSPGRESNEGPRPPSVV